MGSRYGGLKQIDKIDDEGHIIIDFSIYDAIKAGFRDIVFIIKKEIEADFRAVMDPHLLGKDINVSYVFQEIDKLPEGYTPPLDRRKPWGTAHAILCAIDVVDAPFAVINSDDYYGAHAFEKIYNFLTTHTDDDKYHFAMIGYRIKNTVTDMGSVSRGVCKSDEESMLTEIVERTNIYTKDGEIYYTEGEERYSLDPDTLVSMNLWGFSPAYIEECRKRFPLFLDKNLSVNPDKCEFFLPTVVAELISEGKADVKVIENEDKWYGVTYKEEKETVEKAFKMLKEQGVYPNKF